jgi:hypothetical protein
MKILLALLLSFPLLSEAAACEVAQLRIPLTGPLASSTRQFPPPKPPLPPKTCTQHLALTPGHADSRVQVRTQASSSVVLQQRIKSSASELPNLGIKPLSSAESKKEAESKKRGEKKEEKRYGQRRSTAIAESVVVSVQPVAQATPSASVSVLSYTPDDYVVYTVARALAEQTRKILQPHVTQLSIHTDEPVNPFHVRTDKGLMLLNDKSGAFACITPFGLWSFLRGYTLKDKFKGKPLRDGDCEFPVFSYALSPAQGVTFHGPSVRYRYNGANMVQGVERVGGVRLPRAQLLDRDVLPALPGSVLCAQWKAMEQRYDTEQKDTL